MKRFFVMTAIVVFVAASAAFSQSGESQVSQLDEAVKSLAKDVHGKLVEKKANRVAIGRFVFRDSLASTQLGAYWANQLAGEMAGMPDRRYSVSVGEAGKGGWVISGEIVRAADVTRVYSRLVRVPGRVVEASFVSELPRGGHINEMLVVSGRPFGGRYSRDGGGDVPCGGGRETSGPCGGGRRSSNVPPDSLEPDSRENPVAYAVGANRQSARLVNRTITDGDEDFFLITPERTGRLVVETTGGMDTYMHLYNYETGEELASNDDGGDGANARIRYLVQSGTRYLAVVSGYGSSSTGSYGFRAYIPVREGDANSWENPVAYEIGAEMGKAVTVQRTLQSDIDDFFLLVPASDGRIILETTGRIDTYMELYDAESKEMLARDDDGGQGENARIRYDARAGTRYIAVVRGTDSRVRGQYGFRAYSAQIAKDQYEDDDSHTRAKEIKIGETQRRTFHSGDDVDWVKFQVTRDGRYVINAKGVESNRLDTYLELYDSKQNMIAEDDDGGDGVSARLSRNLSRGTYYIKVSCVDDEPDQGYQLSVEAQ